MVNILKYNWKFIKDDNPEFSKKGFDSSSWLDVRVPHDYAINGPFDPENDRQFVGIRADGIKKPIVLTGRTGALPIHDKAWYRTSFYVEKDSKNVFLEFDAIMSNSIIYVNGVECGSHHYGYSSFSVDVTKHILKGEDNSLAVSVNPEKSTSRWYPGAGIIREVRAVEKKEIYLPYCPVFVRAEVKNDNAYIDINTKVCSFGKAYDIEFTILDQNGKEVATDSLKREIKDVYTVFKLSEFTCWDVLKPYLYTLNIKLKLDGELMDEYCTKFGIRTIEFCSEKGFFLNGNNVKLKGVCMHHDLGALGAAFNVSAARRQIEKLIGIGVNAYRTSHNPPAPEILDLCDEYGLLVMDEAFDEWQIQKVDNGYGKYFDSCAKDDISKLVVRDRNHPSVIMWSIGNEINEQGLENGWKIARYLHKICKELDPTRPTTAGFDQTIDAFKNGLADEVDLAGINYKPHLYKELHDKYPHIKLYGSETASTVSSRGQFYKNSELEIPAPIRDDLQVNAYDLSAPPWACNAEREFVAQDKFEFVFGEFVWTGFDYLGEPTPYRDSFPSRSSYFGIFDLVGLEKNRAYSYMSRWTDKDVLHLFPHWNWSEGDVIDVHAYSNFDEVELFVNGKSVGISKKDPEDEIKGHRHIWSKVAYEKGELKAVAIKKPSVIDIINTASDPASIELTAERSEIKADGDDVVYIKCRILDNNGVFCPTANVKLDFTVSGVGEYLASDNGNATSTRVFSKPYCDTFNGQCMLIVRSIKDSVGEIIINVSSENMQTKQMNITSK